MPKNVLPFYPVNSSVNIWIILITGIFFFIVFSWYKVSVELFDYIFSGQISSDDSINTNDIPFVEDSDGNKPVDKKLQTIILSIGFASLWIVIAFMIYFCVNMNGYFSLPKNINNNNKIYDNETTLDVV